MRERSNRAVSKTVELKSSGGSNPPLSDGKELRGEGLKVFLFLFGKMSEWSMVQSWKGCVPKGTGGSNPPLSEFTPKRGSESKDSLDSLDESRCYARNRCPTPSGSEESSGRRMTSVP